MKYLITGGNGFIGRNLVNFLRSKDESFDIVDIDCGSSLNTICLDISYRLPQFKHDTIIHLASATDVRVSIENPRHVFLKNIYGILNCLNLLKEGECNKLIFTSSASSSSSLSPYLASKLACEAICTAYKESYNLNISVLRLSNVYGPEANNKNSVIPKFIKMCLRNEHLTIFGDGNQSRDFIFVDDVVKAIYSGKSGFISTGKLTTIKTIALMVSDISEKLIRFKPRINYEQPICGEIKIPQSKSDIQTEVKIEEGLSLTFKWFMENYVY